MKEVDAIVVKEKKKNIKKIWNKAVKMGVGIKKVETKLSPIALKIVSIFVPESAAALEAISAFLMTETGKKVTDIVSKGYDTIGNVLTGNIEGAKQDAKEVIEVISTDKDAKIVCDTKDLITKAKGLA